jgi:hypothetical protein
MRTNIVIDGKLMQETLRATGLKTKREAVELFCKVSTRIETSTKQERCWAPSWLSNWGGREIALQAARNLRALRKLGVTTRKTIDTVIATRCIESGLRGPWNLSLPLRLQRAHPLQLPSHAVV